MMRSTCRRLTQSPAAAAADCQWDTRTDTLYILAAAFDYDASSAVTLSSNGPAPV